MTPQQLHVALSEAVKKVNARIAQENMVFNVFTAKKGSGYDIVLNKQCTVFYSDSLVGILGWFSGVEHVLAIIHMEFDEHGNRIESSSCAG